MERQLLSPENGSFVNCSSDLILFHFSHWSHNLVYFRSLIPNPTGRVFGAGGLQVVADVRSHFLQLIKPQLWTKMFRHCTFPPIRAKLATLGNYFHNLFLSNNHRFGSAISRWQIAIQDWGLQIYIRLKLHLPESDCCRKQTWHKNLQGVRQMFVPTVATEFTNVVLLCMVPDKWKKSITTTDAVSSILSLSTLWKPWWVYNRQSIVSVLCCFEYHRPCLSLYLWLFLLV